MTRRLATAEAHLCFRTRLAVNHLYDTHATHSPNRAEPQDESVATVQKNQIKREKTRANCVFEPGAIKITASWQPRSVVFRASHTNTSKALVHRRPSNPSGPARDIFISMDTLQFWLLRNKNLSRGLGVRLYCLFLATNIHIS